MPSNRFSVDTNFLIDLAKPRDIAHDALDTIRARVHGAEIIVPPATIHELAFLAEEADAPTLRANAARALQRMTAVWRIFPIDTTDLQDTYARSIAGKLIDEGIIPPAEPTDALIIAESAVLDSQILLSSDTHMTDADRTRLALVLQSRGYNNVLIFSPREIVRRFALRR